MPIYEYACLDCGHHFDVVKKIAQLDRVEECPRCAGSTERRIVPPMVLGDYEAYDCPITGKRIEGRRAHEENLKRHGCRVYEAGETQEFVKNKARRQRESDAEIERVVEQAAREIGLPSD